MVGLLYAVVIEAENVTDVFGKRLGPHISMTKLYNRYISLSCIQTDDIHR
jgi:hypothetical protein